ncbi:MULTISPECIES: hypothetical protein [Rhodococcus]|uniref:hypothetical protein n=1 Tax=Rhodococcus TaxID=1827 RepID=UPI0002B7BE84|nr:MULTISPECIES: hypothetical protein [Rhodococcus]EME16415.1 hypothetical protein G418_25723 [Rhodococcus qingshengii BKS 20-40]OQM78003.1 hypothetical protein B0E55_06048 [Rhodococcus sp. 66b]
MTELADQVPPAAATLSKAEKLEQLRRKMASIAARSDGTEPATPSVVLRPVDEREPIPIVATAQSTLRMLPVPGPIGDLLPRGGLARGTVVSVDGAASVLIGLLATVTAAGGHVAVIGMPGLGLLAFHEQGGDLTKVALVPQPKDAAIDCAAILLEGFDVVVLGLAGGTVTHSRGRAVAARARSKGSLLIVAEGQWDGPDLRISSRVSRYSGLSAGRGRVTGVQLDVAAAGKGFQQRTGPMEIRDDTGQLRWAVDDTTLASTPPLRAAQ